MQQRDRLPFPTTAKRLEMGCSTRGAFEVPCSLSVLDLSPFVGKHGGTILPTRTSLVTLLVSMLRIAGHAAHHEGQCSPSQIVDPTWEKVTQTKG